MPTLRDRLEALRERLLDLSFRNRLLNHSDIGRRVLKVRRLSLAALYALLVDEGKTLTLSAVPIELPAMPTPTNESATEEPPEPFEDTGLELTSELHKKRLPIAMKAGQLDNRLRAIHSQRKAMLGGGF